jgi:Domain of unknown function (DUF4314)
MLELKEGDRIEIIRLQNDVSPMPIGSQGTVVYAAASQVGVSWDGGGALGLALPEDADCFKVVK